MFSVVVIYLYRFREIRICAEIRCHYIAELAKHIRIAIYVHPYARKLVVVNEEVNALVLPLFCSGGIVETDKLTIAMKVCSSNCGMPYSPTPSNILRSRFS